VGFCPINKKYLAQIVGCSEFEIGEFVGVQIRNKEQI